MRNKNRRTEICSSCFLSMQKAPVKGTKPCGKIFRNPLYHVAVCVTGAGRSDTEVCEMDWTVLIALISAYCVPDAVQFISPDTDKCHGSYLWIYWTRSVVKGSLPVYTCKYISYEIHGIVLMSREII
jgi:hypothetical protein